MSGRKVPPLITMAEVAAATGWTTDTARAVVRRAGILQRNGRRWVVSRRKLQRELEEVYQDVYEYFEFGSEREAMVGRDSPS